jgi:hypothetical protein
MHEFLAYFILVCKKIGFQCWITALYNPTPNPNPAVRIMPNVRFFCFGEGEGVYECEVGVVGPQSTVHRVATAAFWRTFSHESKISPGW